MHERIRSDSGGREEPGRPRLDCLGQLLPPLALAKVGAIAATEDLKRNIPQPLPASPVASTSN